MWGDGGDESGVRVVGRWWGWEWSEGCGAMVGMGVGWGLWGDGGDESGVRVVGRWWGWEWGEGCGAMVGMRVG